MDLGDYFTFCYVLASADYAPITRVFLNPFFAIRIVHDAEDGAGRTDRVPLIFFYKGLACVPQEVNYILRDGRGRS